MQPTGGVVCRMHKRFLLVLCSFLCLGAWRCPLDTETNEFDKGMLGIVREAVKGFAFDHARARKNLDAIAASPHPFGSPRQLEIAEFLVREIERAGAFPEIEPFDAEVPNPDGLTKPAPMTRKVKGNNIFAWFDPPADASSKKSCLILLGSHYDTKIVPGVVYRGANDSGSSSVALLEMAYFLRRESARNQNNRGSRCRIGLVWFDGEESVLPGWNDGESSFPVRIVDNTYGSRYSVKHGLAGRANAFVLLDMIGSPKLRLTRDSHSTPRLISLLEAAIQQLGMPASLLSSESVPVADDHLPFIAAGIPALNLIDMHDLSVWHQNGDDPGWVDLKKAEKVSRLALFIAMFAAGYPQEIH